MSQPIILSDEEDQNAFATPLQGLSKKPRTGFDPSIHTVLVLDDDPTPQKPGLAAASSSSTPSFVAETPMSDVAIVKCTMASSLNPQIGVSNLDKNFSESSGLICVESDNDSETGSGRENLGQNESICSDSDDAKELEWHSRVVKSTCFPGNNNMIQMSEDSSSQPNYSLHDIDMVEDCPDKEIFSMEQMSNIQKTKRRTKVNADKKNGPDEAMEKKKMMMTMEERMPLKDLEWHSRTVKSTCFPAYDQVGDCPDKENFSMEQTSNIQNTKRRNKVNADKKNGPDEAMEKKKKMTKEERMLLKEEKKQKKEQERLKKAALKAEAAELKKMEKEKQKWEKGKFAQKSIVAEIDAKVVELGSVGGHLLTRFGEKGFTYRITSNPIERSIVWTMTVPEYISQLCPQGIEIQYVLLVYEAEEFYKLVLNESLLDHVSRVQRQYPSYTICYLTNRLMAHINKREKEQYKNPANNNSWSHPAVEEVLAKLTTHFVRVHSRHCIDEAELAEHVVGLTSSIASCQFRKKLTRLSVNANGSLVPKDSVDRNLIKKSPWLKALVSIPKVQPRFAIAIWKKYPTMKALLNVYMDPNKSVHEKEFLLKDLTVEGLLGGDRRLGEVCSKRVYRVLMAQSGSIKTDDVEDGADMFRCSSY